MNLLQIVILAIVQGAAELLPVSSSAHVIVAEKIMGLDPTTPEMTLLLVMLHTGTMFAVIVYFWKAWREAYFSSLAAFRANAINVAIATAATGIVGVILLVALKHIFARTNPGFEVEQLFGNARLIATGLACAGVLIIVSARFAQRDGGQLTDRRAACIGAVQGLCLPFRGFSRSGATISTAMALGVQRQLAEEFSFALAVVLTPPVVAREVLRLVKASHGMAHGSLLHLAGPYLLGAVLSFLAGLAALRWLSSWLKKDLWYFFGIYCLVASLVVLSVG